jgi:adenosylcobinamide-GDP ribazoletransferase
LNLLVQEVRALHQAVTFFTRLPLPSLRAWSPQDLQRSAAYFPAIGWLVGGVAAAVWWVCLPRLGPVLASGLSLSATLLLTGAFHEDGFADVCDGFGGGYTRERVLEIMRDSRVGAFGAIGVVVLLGLKWQSVAALPPLLAPWCLIAGHCVSRAASASLMSTLAYVREDAGKAKPLATQLPPGRLLIALIAGLTPLWFLPGRFAWAIVAGVLARLVLARWFVARIGGYTGDCLGAAQQVTEVVFYLAVVALAS